MYYVYVLLSLKDQKFYTGFTSNLKRRVKEHNCGKTRSTCGRQPLKLVYYEMHLSNNDARRRETYFKTSKGRTTLKQILRDSIADILQG